MKRVREIFLTQYIGAIAIGMLVVQGIGGIISIVVDPLVWYQQNRGSHSVMGSMTSSYSLVSLLPLVVRIGLYFVVSYFLFVWLYPTETIPPNEVDATAESEG